MIQMLIVQRVPEAEAMMGGTRTHRQEGKPPTENRGGNLCTHVHCA